MINKKARVVKFDIKILFNSTVKVFFVLSDFDGTLEMNQHEDDGKLFRC